MTWEAVLVLGTLAFGIATALLEWVYLRRHFDRRLREIEDGTRRLRRHLVSSRGLVGIALVVALVAGCTDKPEDVAEDHAHDCVVRCAVNGQIGRIVDGACYCSDVPAPPVPRVGE